ncbi:rootletin-like [Melitaea cinxia]|uniref:rootletin-like n=1 Tax=Melitaea cinxia TaxID=113334 RepID=UPI001E274C7E|nr:rootletin-like [Melitaea cinxia]
MPEGLKISQSVSPATRAGAGDISERELSRELCHLTTPPARLQRTYHKKQLFSTPVNKFTAKTSVPSANLERIRSCLDEYRTPSKPAKIGPKAVSLEDLTPTKKIKSETLLSNSKDGNLHIVKSPGLHGIAEEHAAARIGKFMLLVSWRRRREEIRCVRKTLEFQVSCSERLRIQVCTLKSLLDSDNAKVRLAIRELERLKQLLKEKELEKSILEKEKYALEQDVCAAEDRASEISIGWRDCRGELEHARAALAACERALALERAELTGVRAQLDRSSDRVTAFGTNASLHALDLASDLIASLEDDLTHHETLLSASEAQVTMLHNEINKMQEQLDQSREELRLEREAHEQCSHERSALSARVSGLALEVAALRVQLERERLAWWPRPLTRMLGVARSWMRNPMSLPEVVLWTLIPARRGC